MKVIIEHQTKSSVPFIVERTDCVRIEARPTELWSLETLGYQWTEIHINDELCHATPLGGRLEIYASPLT